MGFARSIITITNCLYHKSKALPKTRAYTSAADNSNKFKPAVVYANADIQKMQIIKENKGRCGIYR